MKDLEEEGRRLKKMHAEAQMSADLRRDMPYNTRTCAGLPPTPICLPSLASIQAVLHPEITGALFFVATGEGDGSTYFSKTYEEHQAAVQRFLKKTRRR